jgi:Tol biopolymer transport system component
MLIAGPLQAAEKLDAGSVRSVLERAKANAVSVDGVSLSHDGAVVAFAINGKIEVRFQRGHRQPVQIKGARPQVSPNGAWVAYWSDGGGTRQLWLLDIATSKAASATQFEGGVRFPSTGLDLLSEANTQRISWSRDSRRIAFAQAVPVAAREDDRRGRPWLTSPGGVPIQSFGSGDVWPAPFFADQADGQKGEGARWLYDLSSERADLYVLDVESRELRLARHGEASYVAPAWSPDNASLIALRRQTANKLSSEIEVSLVAFDPVSNRERVLVEPGLKIVTPLFSPDGTRIAFVGWRGLHEPPGLYIISFGNLEVKRLGRDLMTELPSSGAPFAWQDNDHVRIVYRDGLRSNVSTLDVRTGETTLEQLLDARARLFAQAGQSANYLLALSSPVSPASAAGDTRTLFKFAPNLEPSERPTYRPLSWISKTGDRVDAMLLLPHRLCRGCKAPLILDPYPRNG